jgi:hypothetical protein
MRKTIVISILLSFANILMGQNQLELTGSVIDKENKSPIPFASVILPSQSIGTASNNDGDFVLKAQDSIELDTLVISCIGYESKKIALSTFNLSEKLLVELEESVTQLEEVVVKPQDPIELINKAWNKISENYKNDPMMMKGFYRETVQLEQKLISLSEAVISIYKSPYLDRQQMDQMKLLKGRKSKAVEESDILDHMSISGGLLADFVKYGLHSLIQNNFQYYDYVLENILIDGDDATYVISFDQKDSVKMPLIKGKVYIDASSLAFVAVNYGYSPKGLQFANKTNKKQRKARRKLGYTIEVLTANTKVNFIKKGQYWYLQSGISEFSGKVVRKKKKDEIISYRADLVITEHDYKNVAPIPKEEQLITFGLDLGKQIGSDYDQGFWKEYNYMLPNEALKELSRSLLYQQ